MGKNSVASNNLSSFLLKFPIGDLRLMSKKIVQSVPLSFSLGKYQVTIHDIHPSPLIKGSRVVPHSHSFYEGHIVLDGKLVYAMQDAHEVGRGTLILHGPHMPHSLEMR